MSSLLKVSETVATKKIFAIFFVLIALHVTMFKTHAAPALDSSFGNSGIVRIGVLSSYYKVDTILVETSGKVLFAGGSVIDSTSDYLLERLMVNGSPDVSFGTNGRVAPGKNTRFMGKVRAVKQESGAITVVAGTGSGSILPFGTITAFRLDAAGMLDAGFAPLLQHQDRQYGYCVGHSSRWTFAVRNDIRRKCHFAADHAGWHA